MRKFSVALILTFSLGFVLAAPKESLKLDYPKAQKGEVVDDYATAAVTGTLAIALTTLGRAGDPDTAQALAETLWAARDRERLKAAA